MSTQTVLRGEGGPGAASGNLLLATGLEARGSVRLGLPLPFEELLVPNTGRGGVCSEWAAPPLWSCPSYWKPKAVPPPCPQPPAQGRCGIPMPLLQMGTLWAEEVQTPGRVGAVSQRLMKLTRGTLCQEIKMCH